MFPFFVTTFLDTEKRVENAMWSRLFLMNFESEKLEKIWYPNCLGYDFLCFLLMNH